MKEITRERERTETKRILPLDQVFIGVCFMFVFLGCFCLCYITFAYIQLCRGWGVVMRMDMFEFYVGDLHVQSTFLLSLLSLPSPPLIFSPLSGSLYIALPSSSLPSPPPLPLSFPPISYSLPITPFPFSPLSFPPCLFPFPIPLIPLPFSLPIAHPSRSLPSLLFPLFSSLYPPFPPFALHPSPPFLPRYQLPSRHNQSGFIIR